MLKTLDSGLNEIKKAVKSLPLEKKIAGRYRFPCQAKFTLFA